MYEFKSIAEAREFFDSFLHRDVADKFYVSAIQVYFTAFKVCPECEEKFKPKRKDQVYCNTKCGSRKRNREAYRRTVAAGRNQ